MSGPFRACTRLALPALFAVLSLSPVARADPAADATLAIVSFDPRGAASPEEAATISDVLTGTLVNDGKVRVVERAQLTKVMKEQALSASGVISDAAQIKVAQLVGAHWIFVGTLTLVNRTYAIAGRAIDSSSGQVAFADSIQFDNHDLLAASVRQFAHRLQDKLVGGPATATVGVDDFDATQVKEAARQLARQIAVRFPHVEGKLADVLPNNSSGCTFPDWKQEFRGERFVIAGHDSVSEQEVEKGFFLLTEISDKGCSGRVKSSGPDEVSNGDTLRSMPLKVSMDALQVGAGTDPQVGQILSQETRESLKNQGAFSVGDDAQVSFVGRIGGARGHRVVEVQALDKTGAVLQRWDLTGVF